MKMYKRYNSYQDSVVAWLGEIPSHWDESTINALTRVVSRKNRPNEPLLSVYRDYGVILKSSRDDNYNRPGQDLSAYKYVKPTNLVLNKMKTWQGSLGVSEFHGIVSPAYITCELDISNIFPKYLHYLLRCHNYIHEYNRLSYGVRTNQWDMRYDDFKKIPVFLPSNQEQHAIANFLDYKTAEIDRFIANKEKLIALLNEQRAAIINHVVIKGLNPNVQMKPSGVEWLGEIPTHWEIRKIKYISTLISQKSTPEIDAITISPENVESKTGKVLDFYSSYDSAGVKFQAGDVLFNKLRVYLSKVVFAEYSGYSLGEMIVLRPALKDMGKYLFYLMLSCRFIEYCNAIADGVKMPRTDVHDILNAQIPLIPYQERSQITNFLDRETKQIDELVSKERQKIEFIKQYRQALISQTVTGKIDLREVT